MRKTPQHFKRQSVRDVIDKTLGESKLAFKPLRISASETLEADFTTVDFSFSSTEEKKEVTITGSKGKGFIDGLFNGMCDKYLKDYPSLSRITLADFMVNPIMSRTKRSLGADAQASVLFRVEVGSNGPSEFQHQSRSVLYSGFCVTLEAFQFYINAEKAFHKIHFALRDAKARNRGDTVQACVYSLSKLTEVNNYETRQEN